MKHLIIVEDGRIVFSSPIDRFSVSITESDAKLLAKLSDNKVTVPESLITLATMDAGYVGPV